MQKLKNVCFTLCVICLFSCKQNKSSCGYSSITLVNIDTPRIVLFSRNDTIVEFKDTSDYFGVYTFDKSKNLRLYRFFISDKYYQYSEEFDFDGKVKRREGKPLLSYEISRGKDDTVVFNGYLYGLNSTYEYLWIETNLKDTVDIGFLYKGKKYTNTKCFSIKLPAYKKLDSLVFYTKGVLVNTCDKSRYNFIDTSNFINLRL
jgi:hypothetical protein